MPKSSQIPDYHWTAVGLPIPSREHRFHPTRKWRIDFAYPEEKLAIELEGGVFIQGRHTRPTGFMKDIEKYNALTEAGWVLLRYTPKHVNFDQIRICLNMLKV